jgi:hypothetical protein
MPLASQPAKNRPIIASIFASERFAPMARRSWSASAAVKGGDVAGHLHDLSPD